MHFVISFKICLLSSIFTYLSQFQTLFDISIKKISIITPTQCNSPKSLLGMPTHSFLEISLEYMHIVMVIIWKVANDFSLTKSYKRSKVFTTVLCWKQNAVSRYSTFFCIIITVMLWPSLIQPVYRSWPSVNYITT